MYTNKHFFIENENDFCCSIINVCDKSSLIAVILMMIFLMKSKRFFFGVAFAANLTFKRFYAIVHVHVLSQEIVSSESFLTNLLNINFTLATVLSTNLTYTHGTNKRKYLAM